jgi:hypothetical protein
VCGASGATDGQSPPGAISLGSTHNSTSLEPTKGLETLTPRHAPAQFSDAPIWISPSRPDTGCQAAASETATSPPSDVGVRPRTGACGHVYSGRAPNPRGPTTTLDHETPPTHTKRLFIAASAFFLDLSSSSVLKISLVHVPFLPTPTLLKLPLYPAPPKPLLDQERLQLIALSCIRHPGHPRGGRTLCAAIRGNFAAHHRSVQDRSSASFVLPRWTPVEYNRYSCWSGGCIYTKRISLVAIG